MSTGGRRVFALFQRQEESKLAHPSASSAANPSAQSARGFHPAAWEVGHSCLPGAAKLTEAGIDAPAAHFKDKKVRATGVVKEVDKVPRIEIDDARQIEIVKAN